MCGRTTVLFVVFCSAMPIVAGGGTCRYIRGHWAGLPPLQPPSNSCSVRSNAPVGGAIRQCPVGCRQEVQNVNVDSAYNSTAARKNPIGARVYAAANEAEGRGEAELGRR